MLLSTKKICIRLILTCCLFVLPLNLVSAELKEAPSWSGTSWINLPPGAKSLDIRDYRGKVVYLSFFQKW